MRIVHISDIHLSAENYQEFVNDYRGALIQDLLNYHTYNKKIDLIVITGDLVDKGGYSLFSIEEYKEYDNPYKIFEDHFITPIAVALNISKQCFLFIPGNHDVDERGIMLWDESNLCKNISAANINRHLKENRDYKHSERIRKFKEFEQNYHSSTPEYEFTQNQSTYIHSYGNHRIGFILMNDSWRCTSVKLANVNSKFYVGEQQIHDALNVLDSKNTMLNICLFHHAVDDYAESAEIGGLLQRKNIELFLYGHFHSTATANLYSPFGLCWGFRSRAALFRPEEVNSTYHSGYQILDLDLDAYKVVAVHYRKYEYAPSAKRFIADNATAPNDGIDRNRSNQNKGFNLSREGQTKTTRTLNKDSFKS